MTSWTGPLSVAVPRPITRAAPTTARAWAVAAIPASLIRLYALLCALPLLIGVTALAFVGLAFGDRVYPNVAVGGAPVGGLTSAEATARVREHASRALTRPLLLQVGQDTVPTTLAQLGLSVREDAVRDAVAAAVAVGRPRGASLLTFNADSVRHLVWLSHYGESLPLALDFRRAAAHEVLSRAANRLDQPAADAFLELIPTESGYEVHTLPAVEGRRLDVEAALASIAALARDGILEGSAAPVTLEVPVARIAPIVTDAHVAALAARIDAAAGSPIVFETGRPSPPRIEQAALATALRVVGLDPVAYFGAPTTSERRADLLLDESVIARLVTAAITRADEPAEEPRLELQGTRIGVRAGKPGRLVDREAALKDTLDLLRAAAAGTTGTTGSAVDGSDAVRVVPLKYQPQTPTTDPAALGPAAELANARLSLPLTFTIDDGARALTSVDLARLLTFSGETAALDPALLRARLAEWLPSWVRIDPALAVQEPSLGILGGRLVVQPGRPGLAFDLDTIVAEAGRRYLETDPAARTVPVTVRTVAPRRTIQEVLAASPATALVAEPVALYSFAGQWALTTEDLVAALRLTTRAGQTVAVLDADALTARLAALAGDIQTEAQRMGLRDSTGGAWKMDAKKTAQGVLAALESGSRSAPIEWAASTTT